MELWREIPGYEGIYEASTEGRIRTCEGKVTSTARYPRRVWKQRVLKQKITRNKKGRFDARVNLWKDGKEKTFLVSRLVALAWVDGHAPGLTVNHIDGNHLNNRADNLEWQTLADNIRHGFSTGLYTTKKPIRLERDGVVYDFDSYAAAGRHIGRGNGYVSFCLKCNRPIVGADGIPFTRIE